MLPEALPRVGLQPMETGKIQAVRRKQAPAKGRGLREQKSKGGDDLSSVCVPSFEFARLTATAPPRRAD